MITIHRIENSSDYRMVIKGAPERVLTRCNTYTDTTDGKVKPFSKEVQDAVTASNVKLAMNGERVLGFGEQILKGLPADFEFETEDINNTNFPMDGFKFVGMLSLEDPPREAVPAAVASCHEASITVIMVTGDHPLTGRSIAAQIGILSEADGGQNAPIYDLTASKEVRNNETNTGVVVTGDQLSSLDEDDWQYILSRKGIVFARTLPTQKQDIVQRLQDPEGLDHVVAVTGDGVNDSPALKAALVGIAMGSGSEVAKEASDLILLNDDFSSIVKGIEEGRLIFNNLKKSIAYTLTSNIPEIIPFLAQIILKCPLGMTTIMILCIDLGTDILPAISFAYEPAESDIMKIPPRNRHEDKLVTGTLISFSYLQIGIIQAMCAFTCFFTVLNRHGFSDKFILSGRLGFEWGDKDSKACFTCDSKDPGVVNGCAGYDYRIFALRQAQSAFLASIVCCQIGCGLACKTRLESLFNHGMSNFVFKMGLVQEVSLIFMLVYIPGLQFAFKTEGILFVDWVVAIPFAIFLFGYDEARKWHMRTYPDHDLRKWLYY
jgi:sodium/potassium-transporting ATPase subunit alpha